MVVIGPNHADQTHGSLSEFQFVNFYLETYLSDDWKTPDVYQLHLLDSASE